MNRLRRRALWLAPLLLLIAVLAALGWQRYIWVPSPPPPPTIAENTPKSRVYVRTPYVENWDQVPLAEFERQARKFPGELFVEGPTHRKLIALTFDDGPSWNTSKLLDVLAKHKVKATFFWLGREMELYPDVVRRADREGHLLGNHTWDHPDISGLDETTLWDEQIGATQQVFMDLLGYAPHLMRPPYGRVADAQVPFLAKHGLKVIQWSVDTQDWNRARQAFGSHMIERFLQDYSHPEGIVLMHDGGGKRYKTVEAVDRAIPWLRAAGYEFVTVDELLGTRPAPAASAPAEASRNQWVPAPSLAKVPETKPKTRQYVRTPFLEDWGQVPLAELERQARKFPGLVFLEGPTHRRKVALTFDDGPSLYTGQLLDVLAKHKAKATFFWLGREMESYPEMVIRADREGHLLGNHGWNHADLSDLNDAALWNEQIGATQQVFQKLLGHAPHLLRPPYGRLADSQMALLKRRGLKVIDWSVDTQDWLHAQTGLGSQLIERAVQDYVHPEAIVLLHDGGGHRNRTVTAVDRLIPWLRNAGYELVTVDELIGTPPPGTGREKGNPKS
ncbi:polysaccharide deacetylase family protein [Chitiniphilus shinanonensis]|uniref:polysaccharide deacetylase family protein n=1 Tax=Chitiniphilus shinanonensis TaxID=553088 RepID=UPI0030212AFB